MKVGSESWQSSEDHQLLQWIPPYFILSNLYNKTAQCETNFCEEEKICYGEKIHLTETTFLSISIMYILQKKMETPHWVKCVQN